MRHDESTMRVYQCSLDLDAAMGVQSALFSFTDKHAAYCSTVWQYDKARRGPTQYRLTVGASWYAGQLVSQYTIQMREWNKTAWSAWQAVGKSAVLAEQPRQVGLPKLWADLTASQAWRELDAIRADGARESSDQLHNPSDIEAWAEWGPPQLGG